MENTVSTFGKLLQLKKTYVKIRSDKTAATDNGRVYASRHDAAPAMENNFRHKRYC